MSYKNSWMPKNPNDSNNIRKPLCWPDNEEWPLKDGWRILHTQMSNPPQYMLQNIYTGSSRTVYGSNNLYRFNNDNRLLGLKKSKNKKSKNKKSKKSKCN
jgi:hypothetical protein